MNVNYNAPMPRVRVGCAPISGSVWSRMDALSDVFILTKNKLLIVLRSRNYESMIRNVDTREES